MLFISTYKIRFGILLVAGCISCYFSQIANGVYFEGFGNNLAMSRNDDLSSSRIDLGFDYNFHGSLFNDLYINNNGNVTFHGPMHTYTPFAFPSSTRIVAPFFADVDTRPANGGEVYYDRRVFEGEKEFIVTWNDVGYYNRQTSPRNTIQLILQEDGDIGFSYGDMGWSVGSASNNVHAVAGYDAGDSQNYVMLPNSRTGGIDEYLANKNFWLATRHSTPIVVTPTSDIDGAANYLPLRPGATTPSGQDRLIVYHANGDYGPGGDLDQDKPTIVLSHGYNSNFQVWATDMADALHGAGVNANIVAWNWQDHAAPLGGNGLDLPSAGALAPLHGGILGERLLNGLGQDYDQTIHFLGHSLGTRVNKKAADFLHNEGYEPENTHVTIFDAAEFEFVGEDFIPWSNPIPDEEVAYIDNYVSAFGALHSEAVNVQLFAEQPDLLSSNIAFPTDYAVKFHGLPTLRYRESIGNHSIPIGHRWSFEDAGVSGAPEPPNNYFIQTEEGLVFESQTRDQAIQRQNARNRDVRTLLGALLPTAISFTDAIQVVRAVGQVTAGVVEDFTDGSVVRQVFSVGLNSGSPAYAWATIETPEDAKYVTFDVLFEGLDEDDFFAFGIDEMAVLSLDQTHIEEGVLTNVGLLDVSQWAGMTVDFFYGLETAEAGREVLVKNFVFMSAVPEPATLVLLALSTFILLPCGVRRRR